MITIKNKNIIIIAILLIISYQVLKYSNEVLNSVKFAFDIWKNNVFPSIFPFFMISSFLINYGFVEITSELLKPLMKLFGINSNIAFVFVMSILSGFPSNSKYIKELYDNKIIDDNIGSKALLFTHFSNPLFILGTISSLLDNKKIAILILIIHYLTNIIIGVIFKNYHNSYNKEKIDIKKALLKINNKNNNLGKVLSKAITSSIETLLLILGSIAFFSFICVIINQTLHFSNITNAIITGLLEMTTGLKYVSLLNISLKLKATLMTFFISFGGLAIHVQIISILDNTNIKYIPYLLARIIHAAVASTLVFILYNII